MVDFDFLDEGAAGCCGGLLICTVLSSRFKSKRKREAEEGKFVSDCGHSDSESEMLNCNIYKIPTDSMNFEVIYCNLPILHNAKNFQI